jgi:hypothetical protein
MKPQLLHGSRSRILAGIIFAIAAIFVVRLFYLQIIQHQYYVSLAENEQVQRDTARTRGAARAALAGSGVAIGDGSAIVIDRDIAQRGNLDAYNAILSGGRAARNSDPSARVHRRRPSSLP